MTAPFDKRDYLPRWRGVLAWGAIAALALAALGAATIWIVGR